MLVGEPEHPEKTRVKTQGTMSIKDTPPQTAGGGPAVQLFNSPHCSLYFFFLKQMLVGEPEHPEKTHIKPQRTWSGDPVRPTSGQSQLVLSKWDKELQTLVCSRCTNGP